MATSRKPRTRPGTPTPPEKLEQLRALLAGGSSTGHAARDSGISEATVRKYRNEWTADGSLVLPPESIAKLEFGRAVRNREIRPAPLSAMTPEGPVPVVAGGEVGRSTPTVAQPVAPTAVPAAAESPPAPGDVGEGMLPTSPAAAPPARYELPPDEDDLFSVNDAGQVVVNVRFQIPVKHIAFKEQLEDTGQIPRGMNLNTWYVAGMDDYLTSMWGQRLGLVRYVEPPNSDGASPERVGTGAAA